MTSLCRTNPDHGPAATRGFCSRCYNLKRALHGKWSLLRGMDSTGSRRRVQALAWMGWTSGMVAEAAGISPKSILGLIAPDRRISRRNAAAIAAVYGRWSHVQGPSRLVAGKARARGCAPPAAWDEDTIDDPRARPCGVPRTTRGAA